MWSCRHKHFYDVKLVNWLLGFIAGDGDQPSHMAMQWIISDAARKRARTIALDMHGIGTALKGEPSQHLHHIYELFVSDLSVRSKSTSAVVFYNAHSSVVEVVHNECRNSAVWTSTQLRQSLLLTRKGRNVPDIRTLTVSQSDRECVDAHSAYISNLLRHCCHKGNSLQRLPSSPVETNTHFYCKPAITRPQDIAALVRGMSSIVRDYERHDARALTLCASSVNASILASSIGTYLGRGTLTLNHLGPRDKLYESRVLRFIRPATAYVIIADYICMGTEIRIARNNIENHGGVYAGAIAMAALCKQITNHWSLGRVSCLGYVDELVQGVRCAIPGMRS
jgi:hypothetical protein